MSPPLKDPVGDPLGAEEPSIGRMARFTMELHNNRDAIMELTSEMRVVKETLEHRVSYKWLTTIIGAAAVIIVGAVWMVLRTEIEKSSGATKPIWAAVKESEGKIDRNEAAHRVELETVRTEIRASESRQMVQVDGVKQEVRRLDTKADKIYDAIVNGRVR